MLEEVAQIISSINTSLGTDIILKASFDKANRTSINSYRGVGIERGLQMLADMKSRYGLRITTDIHEAWQAEPVSEVADIVQIPALLSRQTDLIVAAARHAKVVNIKKGQMLSAEDMRHAYDKASSTVVDTLYSLGETLIKVSLDCSQCSRLGGYGATTYG